MNKVEEYHMRAAQFRFLSTKGRTPELRHHYLGLAEMCDRMAEQWLTFGVFTGPASHRTRL